ncbi:MAG: response regulator [Candidatus Zapsychrus exili]|nr:response regulator [Candidatus Zapsychrus exili]
MSDNDKTILVVDDDCVVTKLLEARLADNGYTVISANDAAEGLQIAIDQSPDLAVLDVMMPVINGYNLCRLLKSNENYSQMPIIFLTSRDKEDDLKIGQEMGADAYLTKPIVIDDLLDKIAELLNINK